MADLQCHDSPTSSLWNDRLRWGQLYLKEHVSSLYYWSSQSTTRIQVTKSWTVAGSSSGVTDDPPHREGECTLNLSSDEAHFWLNGYVNKQNCRIWSEANPQVYVETPLHPEKLTVWCALWAGGILLQKR
ncbi:hypothetical protein TNCV_2739581 [Trichonephila clavipes]|nr:hypothetical protein TNCV_2739581 [Trichonephila clavipes]